MKKSILLLAFTLLAFFSSFAKNVEVTTAMKVAKHFYTQNAATNSTVNKQVINLSLVYSCKSETTSSTEKSTGENFYYVFNVNTNDGFVIVSGDDIVIPILGYSDKGTWDVNNIPPAIEEWMDNYKQQIIFAKENNLSTTFEIQSKWSELINENQNNKTYTSTKNNESTPSINSVSLPTASWDQGNASGHYNDLCPLDASLPDAGNNSYHCVTGCPATAMAIIMKYNNYPSTGTGFHSYNHPTYGTLSADFGSTTYNWSAMPITNISSANNDIATLMYQCGVSVEMQYGPDGSGGYVITADNAVCSQSAYITYFGYDPATIQGLKRSDYPTTTWKNLLENELNNNRPIQYVGSGSGGGHTFVCDGFDVNEYFHMNWGWGSQCNGYFDLDALNPQSNEDFNSLQQAVIGIIPLSGGNTSNIQMNSDITITPNPINFNQSFTVNADVINSGSSNFSGDFCAAIFDASGNFIDFVQTLTTGGNPLPPGYDYTGGLTFTSSGMLTVPGNYTVGIFYRPTGGNWYLAGTASYSNPISVTINSPGGNTNGSPNNLEIYSNISPSPTTFVQGQPASVNVNFANANNYTYYGQYQASLYDLSGNFVETIGTYNETTGLPTNSDYLSPYITFSTSAITASPGTYLLIIIEEEQSTTQWYYVGGDYYTNPINIDVVAAPLSPDIYENNNTEQTAYILPLNWVSNNAHKLTTGSNIHVTSDVDFYKINLGSGYNYTITARAHDSYNSGNGNTYTCDVLWNYNSGNGWSQTYDDIMSGNITVNGAGTVIFQVSPYFSGQTGTYLLDININRTTATGINEIANGSHLEIYPNPAANFIFIKNSGNYQLNELRIINFMGQIVSEIKPNQSLCNIDISNLSYGIYYLEAINDKQKYYSKFIIAR